MAGIRIGGTTIITVCSPPMGAYVGTGGAFPDSSEVWRSCTGDTAGTMTQLTDFADGGLTYLDDIFNPVLSPNGRKVLFEGRNPSTGYYEIWVVDNTPGSTATMLVSDASNYVRFPAWGPDSDTFLYTHEAGGVSTGGTIYKDTVSAVGSPVSLKAATGGYSPFRAQFSYDGTRVAYIWDKDVGAGCELRCMDADGTNDTLLDNTLVLSPEPPQFAWANTQNVLVYDPATGGANPIYVINEDGTGQTQINSAGAAAGAGCLISGLAWPADDSFVVITANFAPWAVVRAETDGSNTTVLGSTGPVNQAFFRVALVLNGRIWFISQTNTSAGLGRVSSMALDGTGERTDFGSNLGSGDQVKPFVSGDGWYFN